MLNIVFAANESRFQMRVITRCPKCNQLKLFPSAALQKKQKNKKSFQHSFFLTLTATECVDSYDHVLMCDPTKKQTNKCKLLPHRQTKKETKSLRKSLLSVTSESHPGKEQHVFPKRITQSPSWFRLVGSFIPTDHSLKLASWLTKIFRRIWKCTRSMFVGICGIKCSGQPQSFQGDGWRLSSRCSHRTCLTLYKYTKTARA